jgi:RNA polymerase sigma-70 factor (sigma-E family)
VRAEGFDLFVADRWPALLHLARLLSGGDVQRAEDLLQDSLVKLWFVWAKVEAEAPEAYLRKVLVRAAAKSKMRRWWSELPSGRLPDRPGAGDLSAAVTDRTRLEVALAQLPPRQRAAVVLRYYEDLAEAQVAELLDCPVGTVRSHTSRGVARLRQILAEPADSVEGGRRNG